MNRRSFLEKSSLMGLGLPLATGAFSEKKSIGLIGLDTSHSVAFTKIINEQSQFKITHAYPHGSKDIQSSVSRIPKYTKEVKAIGVQVVKSIAELLDQVEFVLLETNDGRLHLEQARMVIEAGKALFIDKPIAASLKGAVEIFSLAAVHQVPVFSSSALRFSPSTQAVVGGKIGKVLGVDTYSPAILEKTHPDLFLVWHPWGRGYVYSYGDRLSTGKTHL